jgi:hypothetical protein
VLIIKNYYASSPKVVDVYVVLFVEDAGHGTPAGRTNPLKVVVVLIKCVLIVNCKGRRNSKPFPQKKTLHLGFDILGFVKLGE